MEWNRRTKWRLGWIGLGLSTLLIRFVAGYFPQGVERLYSRGLFLAVRWFIDYLLAWTPFPLMYLFVAAMLFLGIRFFARLFDKGTPLAKKIIDGSLSLGAFGGALIFFFFFLWAFNYSRLPIERQLNIQPRPLTLDELFAELETETQTLVQLRNEIAGITDSAFTAEYLPEKLERKVRRELESWLDLHDFPTTGKVRGRFLYPKGIFLRFSSAGLYWPFTGEGHVDAGLHSVVHPYVLAHEMSHGYGFGDEGTCNFLAYLATTQSSEPAIAYSGQLDYWQTLAVNCRRYDPERYQAFREKIPAGIRSDIRAIYNNNRRYPDIIPHYRQLVIDPYLKSQGVKEGIKSYDRVIMLVKAWRKHRKS